MGDKADMNKANEVRPIFAALPKLRSVPGAPLSLSDTLTKLPEDRAHTGA